MDKLRHIDELLKESLGQSVEAGIYTSDWLAIEKRLKRRKNRIYAMWFSLSLILLTSVSVFVFNLNTEVTTLTNTNNEITEPLVDNTIEEGTNQIDNNTTNISTEIIAEVSEDVPTNVENESAIPANNQATNVDLSENTPEQITNATNNSADVNPEVQLPIRTAAISYLNAWNNLKFDHYFNTELEQLSLTSLKFNSSAKKSILGFSHIEMGVSFTPSIASKLSSERAELGGLINKRYRDIASESESAAFASSTSFNLEFHFTSNLFIGTGIGITQRTEAVSYNYVIDDYPSVDPVKKVIDGYTPLPPVARDSINHSGSNSYHFIEIPLTIGYAANVGRRFEIRNQIDLSYMLLFNKIGQTADYTYLTLNDLSTLDYINNSNISSTFKSGVYYKFKNFVIGAEPTVSMNLNSLSNSSSALKIKPYYYGFNLTTNIKLNRK